MAVGIQMEAETSPKKVDKFENSITMFGILYIL